MKVDISDIAKGEPFKIGDTLHEMVVSFVDKYCELVRMNRRIGIWDTRRNKESLKPLEEIDKAYITKTERLGRKSVEARARLKTHLDQLFAEIVRVRHAEVTKKI